MTNSLLAAIDAKFSSSANCSIGRAKRAIACGEIIYKDDTAEADHPGSVFSIIRLLLEHIEDQDKKIEKLFNLLP